MNRMTGGVGARIEGRERVEAGGLAQQKELEDAQAQRVREPAEPEQRADVGERQRGAGIEGQGGGDQGEFGAGQVAGGAQRGLVAEEGLRRVGEDVAVAVVRERRGLLACRVPAAGQRCRQGERRRRARGGEGEDGAGG